jgi:mRNA-decapping enzyme subunit 2
MARLLSGLTLSGRTEDTTATRDVGYDSTPSRPVSTDLSSSSLEPSPYLDNLSVTSYNSNLGREAETLDGQRNSVNTPRSTVPPTISTLLPPKSYIPAPLVSSRSGSGGDMSPYSSQGPELPESGKRLKQLALLETVADESARHATISRSGTAMGMAGSPLSYNPPNPASFTPPMNGNHLTNGSPYARPLYGLSAGSNYSQPASATPHISHIPPRSADMYGGVPYIPRRDVRPPSRATAPQNNPSNLLSILQTGPVPNGTHIPANAPYAEHKWHNGPQPSEDPYYMAPLPPTFDRRAASPMLPTNVNRPVTTSNSFRPLPQPHTVSIPSRAPPSSSSTNAANLLSILNAQPGPVSYSRPSPPPSRF